MKETKKNHSNNRNKMDVLNENHRKGGTEKLLKTDRNLNNEEQRRGILLISMTNEKMQVCFGSLVTL